MVAHIARANPIDPVRTRMTKEVASIRATSLVSEGWIGQSAGFSGWPTICLAAIYPYVIAGPSVPPAEK